MKIKTESIPQADDLEVLDKAVSAIHLGATTYEQISKSLDYAERQGRYYRKAGELLGLIVRTGTNRSELSGLGKEYAASNAVGRKRILQAAILRMQISRLIIPFIESFHSTGCTRGQLAEFLTAIIAPTTRSMIDRRLSTIMSWLRYIGLVKVEGSRVKIVPYSFTDLVMDYDSSDIPLLPKRFILEEYAATKSNTHMKSGAIEYAVDIAKQERANRKHEELTNVIARKIVEAGSVPKKNRYIDIAGRVAEKEFIFEVKTICGGNYSDQIRMGVSQLYEYRYIQGIPSAELVLALEKPLPPRLLWMSDYLIKDRRILLIWDDKGSQLFCPDSIRHKIDFVL